MCSGVPSFCRIWWSWSAVAFIHILSSETQQRLCTLPAWRETPFCSERERAVLAWTEALTNVAKTHVPDDVYEVARKYFTEKELADLSLAIVAINDWNRLAVAFPKVPGTYRPSRS